MNDPYLYPNSDVLKNKLGIKDKMQLDNAERDITASKLMQIKDVTGDFNYKHYKDIHKFIFGDIYDWAGKEREIPIQKDEHVLGGMSVQYTYPDKIKKEAQKCITEINSTDWLKMPIDKRAEQYAEQIAALWQVHPFREGNTRTAITFACEFADAHGFPMNKQIFADNPKFTRNALVMASIGEYSEYEHLARIFKDSMEQGMSQSIKTTPHKPVKNNTSRYTTIINDTSVPTENYTNQNSHDEYNC